jgi:predicted phosphodiesterase
MEVEPLVSLFVLSDLHCVGDDGAAHEGDSLIRLPARTGRARTPFQGLLHLIEREKLTADYLLCCGDLTNRAGVDGFRLGWEKLEEVAKALGARSLIFTPGNHDLDVLNTHGTGDIEVCLDAATRSSGLRPSKATTHDIRTDGFEIYEHGAVRLINIDSNGRAPTEHKGKIGKVDIDTVDSLEAALGELDHLPVNIVICHHHPFRHGDIDVADYSAMEGAPELLTMIERRPEATWVIVHGHKHYPRIASVSPRLTVFSAGSVAGTFRGPLQCAARNQCYSIRVLRDPRLGAAYPPVGEFRAWDWAAIRWIDALDGFNIPRFGGFGANVALPDLTSRIADFVRIGPGERRDAHEVSREFPLLRYLPPAEVERCADQLLEVHEIEVLISKKSGEWRQVGVLNS